MTRVHGSGPPARRRVQPRRGQWPAPSHCRQAHDETSAGDPWGSARVRRGCPVLDPDGAAVRFGDLLGNGKSEAGILPETLMRAIGVEALKYLVHGVGSHPRAVVIDENLDMIFQASAGDAHRAAWRGERTRVLNQVVDDLAEARIMPGHLEGAGVTLEPQRDLDAIVAFDLVRHRDQGVE